MSKSSSASAVLSSSAVSGVAGLMLGQVVLALSIHHGRTVEGLGFALVFLLAGAGAVACFLGHRHQQSRPKDEPAPLHTWIATLAVGVMLSMWWAGALNA